MVFAGALLHADRDVGRRHCQPNSSSSIPAVISWSICTAPKYRVQGQDKQAQIDWLEHALANSKAGWKIVVGHHQLYTVTGQRHDFPEMIGPFKPLLDRYGVHAYINGHEHNLEHIAVDWRSLHHLWCRLGDQRRGNAAARPVRQ